jgi:hypothetical protein
LVCPMVPGPCHRSGVAAQSRSNKRLAKSWSRSPGPENMIRLMDLAKSSFSTAVRQISLDTYISFVQRISDLVIVTISRAKRKIESPPANRWCIQKCRFQSCPLKIAQTIFNRLETTSDI